MNEGVLIELCNELGVCAGGVCQILYAHYPLEVKGHDDAILEAVSLLLAKLVIEQGLSVDEVGSCIACFVGLNLGNNEQAFMHIAKGFEFYCRSAKQLAKHPDDELFFGSCIVYNLLHPQSFNDFSNGSPIQEMSFFKMMLWPEIKNLLGVVLPKRLNPILERL